MTVTTIFVSVRPLSWANAAVAPESPTRTRSPTVTCFIAMCSTIVQALHGPLSTMGDAQDAFQGRRLDWRRLRTWASRGWGGLATRLRQEPDQPPQIDRFHQVLIAAGLAARDQVRLRSVAADDNDL